MGWVEETGDSVDENIHFGLVVVLPGVGDMLGEKVEDFEVFNHVVRPLPLHPFIVHCLVHKRLRRLVQLPEKARVVPRWVHGQADKRPRRVKGFNAGVADAEHRVGSSGDRGRQRGDEAPAVAVDGEVEKRRRMCWLGREDAFVVVVVGELDDKDHGGS